MTVLLLHATIAISLQLAYPSVRTCPSQNLKPFLPDTEVLVSFQGQPSSALHWELYSIAALLNLESYHMDSCLNKR